MTNKKIMKGTIATAIALALSSGAIASEAVNSNEFDQDLRLRFHNELRDSNQYGYNDKSLSEQTASDTSVMVQAIMLDYKTDNLMEYADIELFAYTNQKVFDRGANSNRGYLTAQGESYNLFGGALVLKPTEDLDIKIGRWGSDKAYGSFDYTMPLLEYSSIRAMPQMREGVLVDYRPSDSNYKFFGSVVTKDAGVTSNDWTDVGVIVNQDKDGNFITEHQSPAFYAGLAYTDKSYGYDGALRFQDEHSIQGITNGYYQFVTDNGGFVKFDGRAFYAQTVGVEKERNLSFNNGFDSTWVASAQAMYAKNDYWMSASVGQTGANLFMLSAINTDIVYPFDLSLARNRHNTTSGQIGGGYKINDNWNVAAFGIATNGHTTSSEAVEFDGLGGSVAIGYKATEGALKGFSSTLIMNYATEDRNGEAFDFHDIKWVTKYDFNLI